MEKSPRRHFDAGISIRICGSRRARYSAAVSSAGAASTSAAASSAGASAAFLAASASNFAARLAFSAAFASRSAAFLAAASSAAACLAAFLAASRSRAALAAPPNFCSRDADLGDGGAGHEGVAAGATDRALHVLGMDSRFHAGTPYDRALVTDQDIRRLGFRPRQNNRIRIPHASPLDQPAESLQISEKSPVQGRERSVAPHAEKASHNSTVALSYRVDRRVMRRLLQRIALWYCQVQDGRGMRRGHRARSGSMSWLASYGSRIPP